MNTVPGHLYDFLLALFTVSDDVEVRRLPSASSSWHKAGDVGGIAAACERSNARAENVYVGVNPRRGPGLRGNKGVALARCLFVDFDGKHLKATTPAEQVAEVRLRISAACLPAATVIVFSGHGVHVYWRLAEPILDLDRWAELMDALITALGSDVGAKGADRIMRAPGFVNWKAPAALAEIVECGPSITTAEEDIACAIFQYLPADDDSNERDVEKAIAAKVPRVSGTDHASVIDAFNHSVPITEVLGAAGYDVVGNRHFRRPGKADRGFSGIFRPNEHGVLCSAHWSTNDKLNDQKLGKGTCGVHDPFSAFTILSHNGNVTDAVKGAARILNIQLPKQKPDRVVLAEIANGDDADEFSTLVFADPQTSEHRVAMRRVLARHTTNPKQIERIFADMTQFRAEVAA